MSSYEPVEDGLMGRGVKVEGSLEHWVGEISVKMWRMGAWLNNDYEGLVEKEARCNRRGISGLIWSHS